MKQKQQLSITQIISRGSSHRAQRITLTEMREVPTCFWDIEATGLTGDFGIMLCASIKPLEGKIKTFRIDQSPLYRWHPWDDSWLAAQTRNELEHYQIIVHHYGDRYDVPMLNTRLLRWRKRLLRTQNVCFVDTWWNIRKRLKLHSNRLAALLTHLETKETKTGLDGPIWTAAAAGQRSALNQIVKHNVKDVLALEEATKILAGFMSLRFSYLK